MGNAAYKVIPTKEEENFSVHFKNSNETKLMVSARQAYGTVMNTGDQMFDEECDLDARVIIKRFPLLREILIFFVHF